LEKERDVKEEGEREEEGERGGTDEFFEVPLVNGGLTPFFPNCLSHI